MAVRGGATPFNAAAGFGAFNGTAISVALSIESGIIAFLQYIPIDFSLPSDKIVRRPTAADKKATPIILETFGAGFQ